MSSRVIEVQDGSRISVSESMADVYDAFKVCTRNRDDATFYEVFEVLRSQLGDHVREHVYSGRMSELVRAGVIEKADERRDDVRTVAIRSRFGRAAKVTAWRSSSAHAQLRLAA